jgi:serine/threonine protein kinase/Tfp pilus assembly protein PilF
MQENLGRYKILSPLGKGAMGIVYLADDPMLNRQVAVKTIDLAVEDPARREFLRTRLIRDARAAASLTHPNIVSVFDAIEDGETAAIIMEFVDGENLAAYLARNPVADAKFTLHVVRAMAAALDYTHSRGIVHRDIKPANVMLDAARTPKITDFGIARFTEGVTTTMTGAVMGTIDYMAPEQIKGETVDGRADQFALGVVAYRMLSGHTLFGDQSMATFAYKIVNENPAPVRSRNTWLPPAIDPVLAKALAKDPNHRYRTCSEFADALSVALIGIDREAPTIAMAPMSRKRAPKFSLPALVGVVVVAVMSGAALWKPWALPPRVLTQAAARVVTPPALTQAPATAPQIQSPAPAKSAVRPLKAAVKKTPDPLESKIAPPEPEPLKPPEPTPLSAEESFNRGRDAMKNQDYSGALQAFSKAADLRPSWAQAYSSRGNAYQALQQYDAAIRDYSHAILLNPARMNFYLSRGVCYIKLQQDDAALADFAQALALEADTPAALSSRAGIYMRRKDYAKALADLNEVIRLQPDNIPAYRQRANARRALGDAPGARSDVEKANELAAQKNGG